MPGRSAGPPNGFEPVLHVLAPAPAGGLERVVRALARAQAARGQSVTVAAVVTPPGARSAASDQSTSDAAATTLGALEAPGGSVVPLTEPGRGYWQERRAVVRLAVRCNARVAHTHGYRPDIVDAGALHSRGLRTVTTAHGFTGGGWRNRLYQRLQRRAFRRFDAVVAVSDVMAAGLIAAGVSASRVHVIPNAYAATVPLQSRDAARAVLGLPRDAYVIGCVGRLSREKGLDVLLAALAALTDRPIVLAAIGVGGERTRLETQAATLGIADRVRWLGLVNEAAAYYRAFDVFVLSSRTEGTPIALLEAMDACVPIVAAAVGGVPAVVSSAEAVLVPSEDTAAFAAAIDSVRSDPIAATRRAVAARERLQAAYGIDAWLARYDEVYGRTPPASARDTGGASASAGANARLGQRERVQ